MIYTVTLTQPHVNLLRYLGRRETMELFSTPAWFREMEAAGLIKIETAPTGHILIVATQAGRDALADAEASRPSGRWPRAGH